MTHAPLYYVVAGMFWGGLLTLAALMIALLSKAADRWEERTTRSQIMSTLEGLGSSRVQ